MALDDEPGDRLAAPDPPEYPPEWTPEQCTTAYWFAHGKRIDVRNTNHWRIVLQAAEGTATRLHERNARIMAEAQPTPTPYDGLQPVDLEDDGPPW